MHNPKILILLSILTIVFSGCSSKDENNSTAMVSRHNETESHNNGKACMSCHASGGSGKGWFGIAGSVYAEDLKAAAPNGTIYLYSGPDGTGTLVATVEVDGKGNFYTTASAIPSSGAYAQIKGTSGNMLNMSGVVTTGNCGSCHGASTARILIN
jgi:hypothetical protein